MIGLDHLAFIAAVGLVTGVARLHMTIPMLFVFSSALGTILHVRGIDLPLAEWVIAASVLTAGYLIAIAAHLRVSGWIAVFVIAGLFHGYAYGEAVVGAEPTPILAYLAGLVIIQAALAVAIALATRRSGGTLYPRLAGATIGGIGLAVLSGQLAPA